MESVLDKSYQVIGLMSGTSMDGVDVAYIETDGKSHISFVAGETITSPPDLQVKLKSIEADISHVHGKVSKLSALDLKEVTYQSTMLHVQAIQKLIETHKLKMPELIGYHGQTIYHDPYEGISLQLGDPQLLSDLMGIPTVFDFRQNDIKNGGQGAPLAPIYHLAIARKNRWIPSIFINCGGIANVTIILSDDPMQMIAADVGPGNVLIDRFVRLKTDNQEQMDRDGNYARQGKVHQDLLQKLKIESLPQGFYEKKGAKSLSTYDCILPGEFEEISLKDGCATLGTYTVEALKHFLDPFLDHFPEGKIILCGGGWNNNFLLETIKRIFSSQKIFKISDLGFDNESFEAQIFAYLAVRHLKSFPFSFPQTTNVKFPVTGGQIFYPKH